MLPILLCCLIIVCTVWWVYLPDIIRVSNELDRKVTEAKLTMHLVEEEIDTREALNIIYKK